MVNNEFDKLAAAARGVIKTAMSIDPLRIPDGSPLLKVAERILDDQAEAFDRGFLKAAQEAGLTREESLTAYAIACERAKAAG